jgi:hypothetical protein
MRNYVAVVAVLLWFAVTASAQDKPEDVIKRAIKAHGGEDKLGRATCDKAKVNGVIHIGDEDVQFSSEEYVQLPSQFKNTVTLTLNGRKVTLVQLLNGDKAQVLQDGQPLKVTAAAEAEMRETMHLNRCTRLVPLLKEKGFELTMLPEAKVNEQPANVVKVALKGFKDLTLYFDKGTDLLVKSEHMHDDAKEGQDRKEVKQEEYYSKFKDLGGGYTRPLHMAVYRDGKKVVEMEVLELKYLDKLPDKDFDKP